MSSPTPPDEKPHYSKSLGVLKVLRDYDSFSAGPDPSQSHLQLVPFNDPGTVPSVEKWLRALDTIASCLSTGLSGETFAVSVTANQRLSFLVAKSSRVTPADDDAVKEFCSLITNQDSLQTTTTLYVKEHVFPFIIRRCRCTLDKCIDTLLDLMLSFKWELAMRNFLWERNGLVETLFPGSEEYRKRMRKKGRHISFEGMVRMLVDDIIDICQSSTMNFCLGTTTTTVERLTTSQPQEHQDEMDKQRNQMYHNLAHYCKVLRKSHFMTFLSGEASLFVDQELRGDALKLQVALKKICQYVYEVRRLVSGARKFFLDGNISYEWVEASVEAEATEPLNLEPSSSPSPVEDVIGRTLQQTLLIDHDGRRAPVSHLLHKYPLLSQSSSYTKSPQVHPELKIAFHLITGLFLESVDPSTYIPIGTEKARLLALRRVN
ncbi:hypothetical protein D9758_010937 [Tetrapyrgos nigripes]|uniref:Uncharacterized protein n=1 Tax=Tetrapyrgos nigripes TaxID=182062 RepID=A0A8H5CW06_9AGAR|nr:hypothetical protein D9758_010937 [Tetrapyrgos nigripes]